MTKISFSCGVMGIGFSPTQINITEDSIEISHWERGTTCKISYIFNNEKVIAKGLSCNGISNPYYIKSIHPEHMIFIKSLFNVINNLQISEGDWFPIIEKISACFSQYNKISNDEYLSKLRMNKLRMKISELEINIQLNNKKREEQLNYIQSLEERNNTLNIHLTKSKKLIRKLFVISLFWIYIFTKVI